MTQRRDLETQSRYVTANTEFRSILIRCSGRYTAVWILIDVGVQTWPVGGLWYPSLVSKYETPLTRAYWSELGDGTLYEEFRVVDAMKGVQSWRDVDGVVVLGDAHRIATPDERAGMSLEGRDVIVIQTKATRLNPYVFGQALLSMDLIRMRWAPRSLRSVLICVADDPDLRPVLGAFPNVEVHVLPSERRTSFRLERLRGAAAELASQRGVPLVEKPPLTPSFWIDGVIVPSFDPYRQLPLAELVAGEKVTTVHSEASAGQARILGMWMSGEVIAAQRLLLQMGAADVHSIALCRHDQAIEAALRRYASFEIVEADAATPSDSQPATLAIATLPPPSGPRRATPATGRRSRWQHPAASSAGPAWSGADTAQEFIPGHYCRHCGWPFPASRRQTQCRITAACQRRQQLPLHLRGYWCPHNDRVHPEWRDLHS